MGDMQQFSPIMNRFVDEHGTEILASEIQHATDET